MKKIVLAAFAALSLLTSCSLDTDYVYLGASLLVAAEEGGTYSTKLYASGTWTANVNSDESILSISFSPASGTGDTDVTITAGPYKGEEGGCTLGYVSLKCGKAETSFPVYQMTDAYRQELKEQQQ